MKGAKDGQTDGRRREEKGERQTLRRDKERVCMLRAHVRARSSRARVRRAHANVRARARPRVGT